MLFNSYVFILLFLPITLSVYFIIGHFGHRQIQKTVLIVASLFFYAYFNTSYLLIICASILGNYAISRWMHRTENGSCKKAIMLFGIAINLGVLFYFKYFDFFIENVNAVFNTNFMLRHILLPLGISFFTFQQISYVVDSYKGSTKHYSIIDYALFVSFFPQLVAGPIVLHNEMLPQFLDEKNMHLNWDNLSKGLYIFAIGLFKKVLIADTLGRAVVYGFDGYTTLSSLETILTVFAYTFQIYFDFSGYCDMASGIASMFNIKLPANFNSPYKALSIVDFWGRWHISLTRFLREYIYFPLGGSHKGKLRTYVNILIVFIVSGIWHGANWTFILWGLGHGILSVGTRIVKKYWEKMHVAFQWLITFLLVNLGWLLFRAESLSQAFYMFKKMVRLDDMSISAQFYKQFETIEYSYFARIQILQYILPVVPGLAMWGLLALCLFITLYLKNCQELVFKPKLTTGISTLVLLLWSIVSLSGVSIFLYFNF